MSTEQQKRVLAIFTREDYEGRDIYTLERYVTTDKSLESFRWTEGLKMEQFAVDPKDTKDEKNGQKRFQELMTKCGATDKTKEQRDLNRSVRDGVYGPVYAEGMRGSQKERKKPKNSAPVIEQGDLFDFGEGKK
jgi:hypothetical protein